MFITKSFKELFFMAFVSKADAKVRTIFELPKLFEVFFQKVFFEVEVHIPNFVFRISICTASLSIAGAKVELLLLPTKCMKHFFATIYLNG